MATDATALQVPINKSTVLRVGTTQPKSLGEAAMFYEAFPESQLGHDPSPGMDLMLRDEFLCPV